MAKLQEEESVIKKYEEEVMAKLSEKRESLYKPILEKVNKAMMDVAKEGQYTLVFDSSTQILLYADETLDVTKMVKVKLGIQN
jgi:outer membrane protein